MNMKRTNLIQIIFSLWVGVSFSLLPGISNAAVDTGTGDTEIYGSATSSTLPNVLFLVDDSGSMGQPPPNSPPPYQSSTTYTAQKVCIGMLEGGSSGNLAWAVPGGRGGVGLERPPVMASSNRRDSRYSTAPPKKAGWVAGVDTMVSAVKAGWNGGVTAAANLIWNGKMPEFISVATLSNINGAIQDSQSNGISGVIVTATDSLGNTYNATTSSSGAYKIKNVPNGTYTLTPSLAGYTFAPTSLNVTISGSSQWGQDFTASTATGTYTISGNIQDSGGANVSGVTVTITGNGQTYTATTGLTGNYSVSGLAGSTSGITYTVTPTLTGHTFSPTSKNKSIFSSNKTADFTDTTSGGVAATYSINGTISTTGGTPVVGVSVSVAGNGTTIQTSTDASGNYLVSGLAGGGINYVITPTLSGHTFNVTSKNRTITSSNQTADFTDTTAGGGTTYQISGNIQDSNGNNLKNMTVTVTLSNGTVVGSATTSNSGNYTISGLTGGGITYTVTPSDPSNTYTFSPSSSNITINAKSFTADFVANGGGGGGGGGTNACGAQTIYKFTPSGGGGGYSLSGTYNAWGNLANGIQTNCPAAYDTLYAGVNAPATGIWIGNLNSTNGSCTSADQAGAYFLGNYVNWANQTVAAASGASKMSIAISTVQQLISANMTNKNLRMGLITFDSGSKGGTFVKVGGSYTSYVQDPTTSNLTNLNTAVGSLSASTMTPLGGALYESMLYFMGKPSWVTSGLTYTSPIQSACQTNYVIIVTDGMSTSDTAMINSFVTTTGANGIVCTGGDCDGDYNSVNSYHELSINALPISGGGSDYLDDVSYFMHHNDMISTMPGSKVSVFTVGFALDPADQTDAQGITLLTNTAANGGGKFVNVGNAASLLTSLSNILGSILQINTSFVAPVVPVSPANRTYSGNSVYVGLFLPQGSGFWYGNLKKFGFVNGHVVDVTGQPATSTTGAFNSTAKSVWNPTNIQDGGLVSEGGTGAVLLKQTPQNRNLFTYMGTSNFLTSSTNAFTSGNKKLTPVLFGLSSAANVTSTIDFVYGYPGTRPWIMGDILHSEPAVVNYKNNLSVIYVGGNDGMLHAFADINPNNYNCSIATYGGSLTNQVFTNPCPAGYAAPTMNQPLPSGTSVNIMDGQELWGYVPPDIFPNLSNLNSPTHGYGVDGSPAMYYYDANNDGIIGATTSDCSPVASTNCDQVLLVFGERRGGHAYWALNVTDPLNPKVAWHFDKTTPNFSELGESFSQPQIAPVKIGTTPTQIAFIGGGYDNVKEDQNKNPSFATTSGYKFTDQSGRGVYAVNLQTGAYVWSWAYNSTRPSNNPTYSIPSDVTVLDSNNNGVVDTLYVGDVGGQLWKFDLTNPIPAIWSGKIIFQSNPGFDTTKGRKIFYAPDVTYEAGYQAIFFGTGDREHPSSNASGSPTPSPIPVDRLYSVFDKPAYTGIMLEGGTTPVSTNSNPLLMDVTANASPVITGGGWYILMNVAGHGAGEKALSAPLVLNKEVTYTTYAPNLITTSGTCGAALGTGFVYSLKYSDGSNYFTNSTWNNGCTGLACRYNSLGGGIPSGVVVTINASGTTGLVGVGGGIGTVPLATGAQFNQLYWHQPY